MAMGALAYSDLRLPWFLAMLIGLAVGTFIVSATLRPYAARLDGWLKRHGMRSSIPLCG